MDNKNSTKGLKVIDLTDIIDDFSDEGDVEHIIGATGMGKTYEATRRALRYLHAGKVVYTTWKLNLPKHFDQRESFMHVLFGILFFRKYFFRFDYEKNYHYVDLDSYLDEKTGIFDTEKFARFLSSRTDCVFMLDEGQDVFDSHQRAGKIARQSITRTRHMHKKLIIISQRAQAVDVTARGNVTLFYKCERRYIPLLGNYFRVRVTEEIENSNNYPIWIRHDSTGEVYWQAPIYFSGFGKRFVYDAYDSWYMRKQMIRSQDLALDAFEFSLYGKFKLLIKLVRNKLFGKSSG